MSQTLLFSAFLCCSNANGRNKHENTKLFVTATPFWERWLSDRNAKLWNLYKCLKIVLYFPIGKIWLGHLRANSQHCICTNSSSCSITHIPYIREKKQTMVQPTPPPTSSDFLVSVVLGQPWWAGLEYQWIEELSEGHRLGPGGSQWDHQYPWNRRRCLLQTLVELNLNTLTHTCLRLLTSLMFTRMSNVVWILLNHCYSRCHYICRNILIGWSGHPGSDKFSYFFNL